MAYQAKTKISKVRVRVFIEQLQSEKKKKDCLMLLDIFNKITKEKPVLWSNGIGNGIIGYGSYRYVSKSNCQGEWMRAGFAPRKSNLVVYIMSGFKKYSDLMQKLGKYKAGVSCLYFNKLSDIDVDILQKMIAQDYALMCKKYPSTQ